jgi:hypothetical protein
MEGSRLDSWSLLLGIAFPVFAWLLSLAFYGFVSALGFLGHKHTAGRGWLLLGFGGVIAFVAALPAVYPFLAMYLASATTYIGFLSILMLVQSLLKLVAGILFAIGLLILLKEHKGLFRKTT